MYSISNAKKVIGGINTFIHDTNEIVIDRLLELALENIQDFTEEQNNLVGELQYNANMQRQLTYQLSTLKTVGEILASRIKQSLTENEDVTEEAS